jgi:pimeloyl-ACP methyl ester carboxylesterase
VGWLCARGSIHHKTIQLLIHGALYDHHYWNFPYQPEKYSWVRYMTQAGYATLNIDRVGHGQSSKPASGKALDLHVGAYTVHQVVQALRSGSMVAHKFGRLKAERILLAGFSMGAFISTIEASSYNDVDGVILTGYAHDFGPGTSMAAANSYPAAFDPKFAGLGLPFDYLTTVPGAAWGDIFYHRPNADPKVIALDEQLKGLFTLGEVMDLAPSFPASFGVRVPTLVAVGNYDTFPCLEANCQATGSLNDEASYYPPEACVEVELIPDAGHSLNLHLNAQEWFAIARGWADRRIGPSTKQPPRQPCR